MPVSFRRNEQTGQLVKQFKEFPSSREGMTNILKKEMELIASVMCYSQSDSSKFSRFFPMSTRKEEQVTELIDLLESGTGRCVLSQLCCMVSQLCCMVSEEWVRLPVHMTIILHGFGGMGKTTIADDSYIAWFRRNG